jgi:DNA anti-recombination protein RmuC
MELHMSSAELEAMGKDLDAVVERTQKLVDQYHEQNVELIEVKESINGRLNTVSQEIQHLMGRIPDKLNERLIEMKLSLDRLTTDVNKIGDDLKADYVSRTDFEILKVEHEQIKKLVYGFITLVLVGLLTAASGLVFK